MKIAGWVKETLVFAISVGCVIALQVGYENLEPEHIATFFVVVALGAVLIKKFLAPKR